MVRRSKAISGVAVMVCSIAGCHATRPDVQADAARATGIDRAIVFREQGEPVDNPPLDSETLTLTQATRLALEHDARIQSAIAKVRMAEADANQARLLPNPVLGIDVRYPRGHGAGQVFEATISEDLTQLLQKPAQIAAADDRLRGAAADALSVVLDVMAEVQSVFISACEVEAETRISAGRDAGLRRIHEIAVLRQNVGDASRLDVMTLESQIAQTALDSSDLRLRQKDLRLQLAKLIGEPRAKADWRLVPPETPMNLAASESEWLETGLLHRPELQSKVWELRALGDDLTIASLSPIQGANIGAHVERDPAWRWGPTLSIPLPVFDWGQQARTKVEAQRIGARHDLVELQRKLIEEIRLAYATQAEATANLKQVQQTLMPLQKAQLDQADISYRSGDIDLAASLLAHNDYGLAQVRAGKLEESAWLARIRLERAAGGTAFSPGVASTQRSPAQDTQTAMNASGNRP